MAMTKGTEEHLLAPIGNWMSSSAEPWFSDQFAALCDQIVALTISAIIGGFISWLITRRVDEKARQRQVKRDEESRRKQEQRDKQRNLFEYRCWRATESDIKEKQWDVVINTTPWYRYNWVLSASPKLQRRVKSAQFFIKSINPEKKSVELTDQFSSRSQKIPPLGVNWTVDKHGIGHWESDHSGSYVFTFDIGKVIDDADTLVIKYETEAGEQGIELHYISPFDSMKDYRPWELSELKEDN